MNQYLLIEMGPNKTDVYPRRKCALVELAAHIVGLPPSIADGEQYRDPGTGLDQRGVLCNRSLPVSDGVVYVVNGAADVFEEGGRRVVHRARGAEREEVGVVPCRRCGDDVCVSAQREELL